MSYRNLLVKNIAKSLQGRCGALDPQFRSRSAYIVCASRPNRSRSLSGPVDSSEEGNLSETEAMLHQSLQRCRNIYGLIEDSTKDFENEVKLIERIFNKYNDLASQRGHQIMEKINNIQHKTPTEAGPESNDRRAAKDAKKQGDSSTEPYVAKEEDENDEEEDEGWRDLHQLTARCPCDEDDPLYKRFVEKMVAKDAPFVDFNNEVEKYPDPDAIDIFQDNKPQFVAESSTPKQSRASIGNRGLSTGKAAELGPKKMRLKRVRSTTQVTTPAASSHTAAPSPPMKSLVAKPKKKPKMSLLQFLGSELQRDNAKLRKPKSEVYVHLPRREKDMPNKIEQLFKVRYAKRLNKMKSPQFTAGLLDGESEERSKKAHHFNYTTVTKLAEEKHAPLKLKKGETAKCELPTDICKATDPCQKKKEEKGDADKKNKGPCVRKCDGSSDPVTKKSPNLNRPTTRGTEKSMKEATTQEKTKGEKPRSHVTISKLISEKKTKPPMLVRGIQQPIKVRKPVIITPKKEYKQQPQTVSFVTDSGAMTMAAEDYEKSKNHHYKTSTPPPTPEGPRPAFGKSEEIYKRMQSTFKTPKIVPLVDVEQMNQEDTITENMALWKQYQHRMLKNMQKKQRCEL